MGNPPKLDRRNFDRRAREFAPLVTFSLALAVSVLLFLVAGGVATPAVRGATLPLEATHSVNDHEQPCGGSYVGDIEAWLDANNTGEPLTLRVRVLLNGVSPQRGRTVFDVVRASYESVGIAIEPSFRVVRFTATHPHDLIGEAKRFYGGQAPPEVDAVYVLSRESRIDLAPKVGMADCIGGMKWRNRAFAAGPDWTVEEYRPTKEPGMPDPHDPGGLMAAHELGHLLGGVHEYGECADVASSRPCDLMQNVMSMQLVALRFSSLNGAVVRATAEEVVGSRTP